MAFLMIFPKEEAVKVAWSHSVFEVHIFIYFEVKEAIEAIKIIEAVEVIMADGANEATEVVRFT